MTHEDTRYPDRTDDCPDINRQTDTTVYTGGYTETRTASEYGETETTYGRRHTETDTTDGYTEACKKREHDMIHEDAKYTDTGLYKNIGELIRDCARDMSIDELEAWADDVDIALMAARKERGRKSVECHTLASELDNIMTVLKEKRGE